MNSDSSRSHAVLQVSVHDKSGRLLGKVCLVDLAGKRVVPSVCVRAGVLVMGAFDSPYNHAFSADFVWEFLHLRMLFLRPVSHLMLVCVCVSR